MSKRYQPIVAHYEATLAAHGDTNLGVDWPDPDDAETRYQIHLEMVGRSTPGNQLTLLDFGCGASHLYDYMLASGIDDVIYSGLDISQPFIDLSRSKHADVTYYRADVLEDDDGLPAFDYVIMNGVLTQKLELPFDAMFDYAKELISAALRHARIGLSFNVMSAHAEWKREDLFQLPLDAMAEFVTSQLSESFLVRNDYGLDEYTVYVFREPDRP
jgi:Methyltransferase domain